MEALERGCHVLVEKPLAESAEDARRIGELREAKGLVASVDHSLLYDPQVVRVLEKVRAGAIGRSSPSTSSAARVPALRGRAAAAAPPRRRLSLARPRRALPVSHPGAARADRGRGCRVEEPRRRPEPRLRRMARARALQRGPRAVPALLEREADAEPDRHPRHERAYCASTCSRCSIGKRSVDAAAEGGRAGGQRVSPTRCGRSSTCRAARGSSCASRSRRSRACATSWPTSTAASRPGSRRPSPLRTRPRWCGGPRRSRARPRRTTRRGSRGFEPRERCRLPGDRRVGLARHRRSCGACSPRASRVRALVRRIPDEPRRRRRVQRSGNLGDPAGRGPGGRGRRDA